MTKLQIKLPNEINGIYLSVYMKNIRNVDISDNVVSFVLDNDN